MDALVAGMNPAVLSALPLLLAVAGAALVVAGVRLWRLARVEPRDLDRALLVARGFRRAIIGATAIVFAAAWWTDVGWLMGLAAIIAGEETLESSVHVAALRDGVAARARREGSSSPTLALPS